MRTQLLQSALVRALLVSVLPLAAGCELLVSLDRSAVEVEDAGCPICADSGDDGATDATATDGDDGGPTPDDASPPIDGGTGD